MSRQCSAHVSHCSHHCYFFLKHFSYLSLVYSTFLLCNAYIDLLRYHRRNVRDDEKNHHFCFKKKKNNTRAFGFIPLNVLNILFLSVLINTFSFPSHHRHYQCEKKISIKFAFKWMLLTHRHAKK